MALAYHFQLLTLIATTFTRYGPGECHDLGPRNIIRFEKEPSVYIPCPFSGSANHIWRINGVDYEAFNLPKNMLPVPHGLLITTVELGMDGRSFQCISRSGQSQELSSVGILKVVKLPQEYVSFFNECGDEKAVYLSPQFSLNHQKTIFEDQVKIITWNADTTCNMYRVTSVNCDNEEQHIWDRHVIQGTTLAIPSSFTVDSKNHSLYFTLESVDSDGHLCNRIITDFTIEPSDITQNIPTSYNGYCVEVQSLTSFPVVVLPSRSGGNDCPCLITIRETTDTYNLTRCSCAADTLFVRSFSASTVKLGTNSLYTMCFSNLTRDMNNTVIHVYELHRSCINDDGSQVTRAYRKYANSFKLLIELPYPPSVTVNTTTGEVHISSDEAEGIKVSHYTVILRDVTFLIVEQRTIPPDTNNISFGDLFQQHTCSPYYVIVSAYSTLGKSNSNTSIVELGYLGDMCDCIAQSVEVDLDLLEGDTDSDVPTIGVLINCTQIYYKDDVMLNISIKHHDVPINESFTIMCKKTARFHYTPLLQCGQHYDLEAYWIQPNSNTRCKLSAENFHMAIPCPDNINVLTVAIGCVLGGLLLISTLVSLIVCLMYLRKSAWRCTNPAYKHFDKPMAINSK